MIRSVKDKRNNTRTYRDRRDLTHSSPKMGLIDSQYTGKNYSIDIPADTGHPSRTDHLVDHAHEIARDELIPQIETMSANAVLTDRREFYYYKRKRTGRRCSCFESESSPDAKCMICLGTGVVGGYEKLGTKTEVIDFTHPSTLLVNVKPNLDEDTRPVFFKLEDGFNTGYIETEVGVLANIGLIDTAMLYQPIFNQGTRVTMFDPQGHSKDILDVGDINDFLKFNKVRVRITLESGNKRPYLSHYVFRYKTSQKNTVYGDIPRWMEEKMSLGSFGAIDFLNELKIFFDAKQVRRYNNEDLLIRLRDGKRLKIITVEENWVTDRLTSNDVSARFLIKDTDFGGFNLLS